MQHFSPSSKFRLVGYILMFVLHPCAVLEKMLGQQRADWCITDQNALLAEEDLE